MSLPACQERALSSIEGALKASEPHLASMFAIFTRLNQDEPVGAEPLARVPPARGPLRWLRPRRALSAIVLIPVMFAAVIVAALLSGSARGATTCDAGYPVGEPSSLVHRPSCPRATAATSPPVSSARKSPPASSASKSPPDSSAPTPPPASSAAGAWDGGSAAAGNPTSPALCTTAAAASRFVAMNGVEQVFSSRAPAAAMTSPAPGMC
jgi:hypothetical protein